MENVVSLPDYRREKLLGLTYTQVGDYLYPNITLSEPADAEALDHYGMKRKRFLKENHRAYYGQLVNQERLYPHCREVQKQARQRHDSLMNQLLISDPPPAKETDSMAWTAHMNMLDSIVSEMIHSEIICDLPYG